MCGIIFFMNIANQITVLRIILSFVCIWFIVQDTFVSTLVAFSVFIIASLTDYFDGFIARKLSLVSDLGKILDPIADKVLVIGVFVGFLACDWVNVWVVIVIMLREFIITSLRFFGLNKGVVIEAKFLGKYKTVSQIVGIVLIFVTILIVKTSPENAVAVLLSNYIVPFALWYIILITLYSGFAYLWDNRKVIKTF